MCSYASPQISVLKYIFDSLLARSIVIYISYAQAVSLCFENAFKRKPMLLCMWSPKKIQKCCLVSHFKATPPHERRCAT